MTGRLPIPEKFTTGPSAMVPADRYYMIHDGPNRRGLQLSSCGTPVSMVTVESAQAHGTAVCLRCFPNWEVPA